MVSKKVIILVLVVGVIAIIIGGAATYFLVTEKGITIMPESKKEVNALTFYHWWTSPGEAAAVKALINVFIEKYPDTAVMPTPVVGGAGYSMLKIIKPMVLAKEAPDAFQMHPGYEAKPYFDAGLLDPIDDIWASEGLGAVIPGVVQDMCKFEGHYYSVPVNIHRVNVVWYNKRLLDANNIDPTTLTTWDAFFNACDKLRTAGIKYPIQMGASWTAAHVFESIIASIGIDFYEDWINGKITSADDPRLLEALKIFKTYLGYVNLDRANLEWNHAIARIISGEGAFNIMGDWANGEFEVAEMVYGLDYGAFPVPGTENMYGLCIDTFQHPKGISHPTNSDKWLRVVGSKQGQDAFNPLKGSISARIDSDVTKYGAYQQSAISDFEEAKYMFPSVVHGSGAPESFKVNLKDIISTFTAGLDVNQAASVLTSYTAKIIDEYTVVWSLGPR